MQTNHSWDLSRKQFVKSILVGSVALQLPWLTSCSDQTKDFSGIGSLTDKQFELLRNIQDILFPADGNGPGAWEIHADKYTAWVLSDPNLDPDEQQYIIQKLDAFDARCIEKTGNPFQNLSPTERHQFVAEIAEISWGRKLLSRLLTFIFEALLLDPKYDVNPNGIGWKWLNHDPGNPRPTEKILYPAILEFSHEI